jgi:hypothetical protein
MTDRSDFDGPVSVVEVVQDPVTATTCCPSRRHRGIMRFAHSVWVIEQRAGNELIRGGGHFLRQYLSQRSGRWAGNTQSVPLAHWGKRPASRIA